MREMIGIHTHNRFYPAHGIAVTVVVPGLYFLSMFFKRAPRFKSLLFGDRLGSLLPLWTTDSQYMYSE